MKSLIQILITSSVHPPIYSSTHSSFLSSIYPSTRPSIQPPTSSPTQPAFLSSLPSSFLPSFLIFLLQNYVPCTVLGTSPCLLGLTVYWVRQICTQLLRHSRRACTFPPRSISGQSHVLPLASHFPSSLWWGIVFRNSQSAREGLLLC